MSEGFGKYGRDAHLYSPSPILQLAGETKWIVAEVFGRSLDIFHCES